jgi:hypothetical protein
MKLDLAARRRSKGSGSESGNLAKKFLERFFMLGSVFLGGLGLSQKLLGQLRG